jgi:hypothetical protein
MVRNDTSIDKGVEHYVYLTPYVGLIQTDINIISLKINNILAINLSEKLLTWQ